MCQKSSRFPSPSFLEKKEFPREAFLHSWHLRRRCSQSKAALFCLFIRCCWRNNISDGGRKQDRGQSASQLLLKRHRAFPRRAGHRLLDFSLREERSFPPFQDLLWGERTGADVGGYWRSLPANSYGFLIQQIGRGNGALTWASVKISTLGTMSLSPHFFLILLLHLFPHLSHSGISWTAFASSSEAITFKIQRQKLGWTKCITHHLKIIIIWKHLLSKEKWQISLLLNFAAALEPKLSNITKSSPELGPIDLSNVSYCYDGATFFGNVVC